MTTKEWEDIKDLWLKHIEPQIKGKKRKKRSKKGGAKKGQKMSVKCLITRACMQSHLEEVIREEKHTQKDEEIKDPDWKA